MKFFCGACGACRQRDDLDSVMISEDGEMDMFCSDGCGGIWANGEETERDRERAQEEAYERIAARSELW